VLCQTPTIQIAADPRQVDVQQQRDTKAEYHFRGHSGRRVDEGDRDAASEDRIAQQVLIVLQPDIAAAEQPLALRVTCEAEIKEKASGIPKTPSITTKVGRIATRVK